MRLVICGMLVALVAMSGAGLALADEKGTEVESKVEKVESAAAVDFGGELGLSFASLGTLGQRIDAAREAMDPVGLASAASELRVAEQVAGKTASLTATALAGEAVDLAKQRYIAAELRAVALLAGDEKVAKELTDLAVKADEAVAAAKEKKELEVRERGIGGVLHVDNRTRYYITIYINGIRRGTVGPYGDGVVYVGNSPWSSTRLYGRAPGTGYYWRHTVRSSVNNYTWRLWN